MAMAATSTQDGGVGHMRVSVIQSCSHSAPASPAPRTSTPPSLSCSARSLLASSNLVGDEKLVVATLATLDSGDDPSNIIKEELKMIIESRRKAEGKEAIKVQFTPPKKDELRPEEVEKVLKRKEQNRLAAQRFRQKQQELNMSLMQLTQEDIERREKRRERNRISAQRCRERGKKRKHDLLQEIAKLQNINTGLEEALQSLREEKSLVLTALRDHLTSCSCNPVPHAASPAPPPLQSIQPCSCHLSQAPLTPLSPLGPITTPAPPRASHWPPVRSQSLERPASVRGLERWHSCASATESPALPQDFLLEQLQDAEDDVKVEPLDFSRKSSLPDLQVERVFEELQRGQSQLEPLDFSKKTLSAGATLHRQMSFPGAMVPKRERDGYYP